MKPGKINSYKTLSEIEINNKKFKFYSLKKAEENGLEGISKLPKSLKVLLENLLRYEDDVSVTKNQIEAIKDWLKSKKSKTEIAYRPARVLLQDYTGIPAVADLAAMREAVKEKNKDPNTINPLSAVDLVIDHSVQVDQSAKADSFDKNVEIEFNRNGERYSFLKWGQQAFNNFRIVPPGTGICHQVNLEYLSKVVWSEEFEGQSYLFPDTLVGTDSHTTMVNGLSVLGWGVGGIEAEAGMLGQPISMLIPEVIGFEVKNKMPEGTTATDLVLTVVKMLRDKGVVGKFVEFYGDGLKNLTLADRATIANMAPEYGATCGFFPIDEETIKYLKLTSRDSDLINTVEKYNRIQGLWADDTCNYNDTVHLQLENVQASLAGPKRPQDRINLEKVNLNFKEFSKNKPVEKEIKNHNYKMQDGNVVIAAITSCTNTSNPDVLVAAGLVAKKACELGLQVKPWVKTSLAPGSKVVTDYLAKSGLNKYLDQLGFHLVGYGCTTCIGNSGPLDKDIAECISKNDLTVASVLSGNRNFEGRVNPHVKANYLASPPLVVAYALAGSVLINLTSDPIGIDTDGNEVFLKDIWPSNSEIRNAVEKNVSPEMFKKQYSNALDGPKEWQKINTSTGDLYNWNSSSTYVQKPPFFDNQSNDDKEIKPIENARPLLLLGNSVTTDHISPAGAIKVDSPAGNYFMERQIRQNDFNSYGARRGNHEVMVRGTFANIRIKNQLLSNVEGGYSILEPDKKKMSVYDVAMEYAKRSENVVVFAGEEYGTGSSRDWAAKGTKLLGIKAVIAESFERIHRSNLVGMGVLPIQLKSHTINDLNIQSSDLINIKLTEDLKPLQELEVIIQSNVRNIKIDCILRIDTINELQYYKADGILNFVLKNILKN